MGHLWKCESHNRVMEETLDDSRTIIIPYCSSCDIFSELARIIINKNKEYNNEKIKRTSFKTMITAIIPGYILGLVTIFFGLGLIYFVITEWSQSELSIISSLFMILIGLLTVFSGSLIIYWMYHYQLGPKKPEFPTIQSLLEAKIDQINLQKAEVEEYKEQLKLQYLNQQTEAFKMDDIDLMSGYEFEEYVAVILKKLGYSNVNVTQQSGDFGADIIAVNQEGVKVAVQCKRYGKQKYVGILAIQEIFTAMEYYDCQQAMVITNSFFTKQADQTAQKVGVTLWNRNELAEKVVGLNKKSWNDYLLTYYIDPKNNRGDYEYVLNEDGDWIRLGSFKSTVYRTMLKAIGDKETVEMLLKH
ncbi:restriction endonuclease [Neobacillus drentensis]|uniref:restriction endonuclease n=1 Tax=Neobacillus drentensis TaxID=220684 RepID=UPI002FFEA117